MPFLAHRPSFRRWPGCIWRLPSELCRPEKNHAAYGIGSRPDTNIFADGALIATEDSAGRHYQLNDWLGNRRMQVDPNGNIEATYQAAPYGDLLNNPPSTTEHYFTGKERDSESGLDYFGARYYGSSMGRFMSPDPAGPWVADVSDPQSWNFYAYARNNPLINTDPTGLDCAYFNDAGNGVESIDRNSNSGECGQNGGDWVNGHITSSQYFADSDTFGFRSSDSQNNYLTYANAPGTQSDGTTCAGNCDTANGYLQSSNGSVQDVPLTPYAQAVFGQVAQQTAPLYNGMNTVAGCVANNTVLAPAAAVTSALGAPVPKSLVFGRTAGMGGEASSFMSGASAAEVLATGGRAAKFSGTAAKVSRAVTGTARIGGAIGRVAGPAAVVLDTALVANCIRGH